MSEGSSRLSRQAARSRVPGTFIGNEWSDVDVSGMIGNRSAALVKQKYIDLFGDYFEGRNGVPNKVFAYDARELMSDLCKEFQLSWLEKQSELDS